MSDRKYIFSSLLGLLLISLFVVINPVFADEEESKEEKFTVNFHSEFETNIQQIELPDPVPRFVYDSGVSFEYPEAVRGIYLTGHTAGGSRFDDMIGYVNETELNAMVIDVKEDNGNIMYKMDENSLYHDISKNVIKDPRGMIERLEEEQIYPIARVVVFKDTSLAHERPEWSFTKNGEVWKNGRGEAFVNPFVKEVWDYNVEIAKHAAELGFQEIQFDYVRFPEGFEHRDEELEYSRGEYDDADLNNAKERVKAVTDFVEYARNELEPYDIDVSVDIFGYSATLEEAPGIGQNFLKISNNVDVISSMIYPSHWTPYFGIDMPDKEPYRLVDEYSKVENEVLSQLEDGPTSRPWLQDFSAPWLYPAGQTFTYGKNEVQAQIDALYDNGIYEYLLWNPVNRYTEGVDYDPSN
ncbi:GTP-binding protein [Halalkalibacillus sediminis]|uniref:GTP-binding protein n=1 Tax=Halalkalibacillus sediminis TaxID=2018042 RepID=A0A2I0QVK8_9BACI|nr:putative glycoside hydrolase [Halalkalibacillus sediminis]PKR78344.1 GTP-binding protein [Halalkalibacillus sediminis]